MNIGTILGVLNVALPFLVQLVGMLHDHEAASPAQKTLAVTVGERLRTIHTMIREREAPEAP